MNAGDLGTLGDAATPLQACYARLAELNQLVAAFRDNGNTTVHSPLLQEEHGGYGRDDVIDIIAMKCDDVLPYIRDASSAVGALRKRTCPACGERFASAQGMKSHVTQKSDRAHTDASVDL